MAGLTNGLILFGVFAGHCELMACWCNRAHALRFRHRVMSKVRLLHDAVVLGAAPGLLFGFGLFGPRLLRGGTWDEVPWGWRGYFLLCGAGVVSLLVCTARHLFRTLPAGATRTARRVDVAAELGFKPIGDGPRRGQARVWFNQQFTLEVAEVTVAVPGLPAGWDGATVGHLSDTHFRGEVDRPFFERAFAEAAAWRCDLYAFTGDLLDDPARVDWLPQTFGRLAETRPPLGCHFLLGNHDWHFNPAPLRASMEQAGWRDATAGVKTLHRGGDPVALGGDESPWLHGPPDWSAAPPGAFRLLLSHTPDNFRTAAADGVGLMLAGHNHGGQITLPVIGPVYAPSRHGVRHAGGLYRETGPTGDPLLIHVSRGLAGRQPVRFGATPELTRLTLRCGPAPRT